jgi:hypothetical protein
MTTELMTTTPHPGDRGPTAPLPLGGLPLTAPAHRG